MFDRFNNNNNNNNEKIRKQVIDYYGTAMSFMPMAVIELSEVERASNQKLIELALKNNFDLSDYETQKIR